MTGNINEFIRTRESDWQRLEQLIRPHYGRSTLTADEVDELGTLYRAVISDLALARRDFPGERVTLFLNQLLTRAHSFVYKSDTGDLGQIVRYFTQRIPRTFRQTALFTLTAFLLFIIPAIVGYRLAVVDPVATDMLGLSTERATLEDQQTWTNIPLEERPYASAFIMSNNIRVAILAFAGGMSFGIFSIYVLTWNGLVIGAVIGLAAHYGMGESLIGFVAGHGVIELSVIFIAGGTGLQLAWALLNPGPYTRRDALSLTARRAVVLVVAAIPLLVCAGLIEGFVSPSALPFPAHIAVGIGTGILLYAYLGLVGHERTHEMGKFRPQGQVAPRL